MLQRSLATLAVASVLWSGCSTAVPAATPADCGGADKVVSGKLRALLVRDDAFSQSLAAHSLPSLEQARALCAGPFIDAALRLYGRLLLEMEMQLTAAAGTAEPPERR
jgi:hypothetical protein